MNNFYRLKFAKVKISLLSFLLLFGGCNNIGLFKNEMNNGRRFKSKKKCLEVAGDWDDKYMESRSNIKMIKKKYIQKAINNVPEQYKTHSCTVNSLARWIYLMRGELVNYNNCKDYIDRYEEFLQNSYPYCKSKKKIDIKEKNLQREVSKYRLKYKFIFHEHNIDNNKRTDIFSKSRKKFTPDSFSLRGVAEYASMYLSTGICGIKGYAKAFTYHNFKDCVDAIRRDIGLNISIIGGFNSIDENGEWVGHAMTFFGCSTDGEFFVLNTWPYGKKDSYKESYIVKYTYSGLQACMCYNNTYELLRFFIS